MKKYEFEMDEMLYRYASKPIREKYDLLLLLVQTMKFILITPYSDTKEVSDENKLIINVDKMSRVIFCMRDKIFSFQFPIQIRSNQERPQYASIYYKDSIEIDSIVSSILLAILNQLIMCPDLLDNIGEMVLDEFGENEWETANYEAVCELIKVFIMFEPGYVRYDHDIEHMKGLIHPEYHLDFFFSSNSTMKLGLKNAIEDKWMIDMLDVCTECKFVT